MSKIIIKDVYEADNGDEFIGNENIHIVKRFISFRDGLYLKYNGEDMSESV